MTEPDELETELKLFHENVQRANLLTKTLRDAAEAMRAQNAPAEGIPQNDTDCDPQYDLMEDIRANFHSALSEVFRECKSAVQPDASETAAALKEYNQNAKAAHDEMLMLYAELTELAQCRDEMTKQGLLMDSLDQQCTELTDRIDAFLQSFQQSEQERLLQILQTQQEQNPPSLASDYQTVKDNVQHLKDASAALAQKPKYACSSFFRRNFRKIMIVLIVLLLCIVGLLGISILIETHNAKDLPYLGAAEGLCGEQIIDAHTI